MMINSQQALHYQTKPANPTAARNISVLLQAAQHVSKLEQAAIAGRVIGPQAAYYQQP